MYKYLEGCPWALLVSQRWYTQPLHGFLSVAILQLADERILRVLDQLVYVFVDVKMS